MHFESLLKYISERLARSEFDDECSHLNGASMPLSGCNHVGRFGHLEKSLSG